MLVQVPVLSDLGIYLSFLNFFYEQEVDALKERMLTAF